MAGAGARGTREGAETMQPIENKGVRDGYQNREKKKSCTIPLTPIRVARFPRIGGATMQLGHPAEFQVGATSSQPEIAIAARPLGIGITPDPASGASIMLFTLAKPASRQHARLQAVIARYPQILTRR